MITKKQGFYAKLQVSTKICDSLHATAFWLFTIVESCTMGNFYLFSDKNSNSLRYCFFYLFSDLNSNHLQFPICPHGQMLATFKVLNIFQHSKSSVKFVLFHIHSFLLFFFLCLFVLFNSSCF